MVDARPTNAPELIDAYVDAAEAVLNLNLPLEYRAGVAVELQRLLQMAGLFSSAGAAFHE
jgi:hypothetical protein